MYEKQYLRKMLTDSIYLNGFTSGLRISSTGLTLGRTHKFTPPPWYKEGGVDETPPGSFWYDAVFWKDFTFTGKTFDLLNKMRYILGVGGGLLEACDVTNNSRHLGRHLGFYQELEIRLKPWEMVIFCALHDKYLLLFLKEVEKTCIFTQNWLYHLLLMMSYLITIATDHH